MKKKNVFAILALVLTLALLIPALISVPADAASKKSMKLNKKTASIDAGKTVQLKVKNNKKKVTWSSSNKSVATVSKKGLVTGKKPGKATITAKVGKKKLKCKVTVKEVVASLSCIGKKAQVKEMTFRVKEKDVYTDIVINITCNGIKYRTSDTSIGGFDGACRYDAAFTGTTSMGEIYKLENGKKVPAELSAADKAAVMQSLIKKFEDTYVVIAYKNKVAVDKSAGKTNEYQMKSITAADKDYNGVVSAYNQDYTSGAFTFTVTDLRILDPYSYYTYNVYNDNAYDLDD